MPKKFKGENSKAVVARQRKESARLEEKERKQKELDDEYWRDDDKHSITKQNRKEERERKRVEQLERKKEAQKLLTEEIASIHTIKPPAAAAKLTRAEIQAQQDRMAAAAVAAKKSTEVLHNELPLVENINRDVIEEGARGVYEAIDLLSVKDPVIEKHPEKRMKAAYVAFEEVNLPRLKAENPNLRLSQLKQMLKKDWMKSPDNPMNQRSMAFNRKQ